MQSSQRSMQLCKKESLVEKHTLQDSQFGTFIYTIFFTFMKGLNAQIITESLMVNVNSPESKKEALTRNLSVSGIFSICRRHEATSPEM